MDFASVLIEKTKPSDDEEAREVSGAGGARQGQPGGHPHPAALLRSLCLGVHGKCPKLSKD